MRVKWPQTILFYGANGKGPDTREIPVVPAAAAHSLYEAAVNLPPADTTDELRDALAAYESEVKP